MFGPYSRYATLEVATLAIKDGQGAVTEVKYVRRRFVGRARPALLARYRVRNADRLDNVTATYYGDPTHFWRIADANRALEPAELCELPGRLLDIPAPTG